MFEAFRNGQSVAEARIGVLARPEVLRPTLPVPEDFDAFWEKDQYETAARWMKDMGGTLIMLSDEDYAKARELTLPLNKPVLDIMKENGIPTDKLEKRFYELSEKYYSPWQTSRLVKVAGLIK